MTSGRLPVTRWRLATISLGLVAAFYLLREHWGHALGLVPYLLLLACPLLHLLHRHGGHGRHDRHRDGARDD